MPRLLSSSDIKTTQEAAKLVANFAATSVIYVQAVFDAALVPLLIDLLYVRSYKAKKVRVSRKLLTETPKLYFRLLLLHSST